ncbi:T9SS type A sorting domain-containing protein [Tenacibaculum sp. M341]|nr:T9SS type A sorting domain-containing protein [Tenacibaculum sp. M341]
MKKTISILFFFSTLFIYCQSVIGNFNTGTIVQNSYIHSIGEIYIASESNTNKISSGIINIASEINFITLSIDNIDNPVNALETKIFPNPTKRSLTISINKKINRVEILDLKGRKLKSYFINNDKIDISDLSTGLYFIKFPNTKIAPIKILKN